MIRGTVSQARKAVITIRLRCPGGQELEVDAVIDTGFNRYLTLPASLVAQLGLRFVGTAHATLADGRVISASTRHPARRSGSRWMAERFRQSRFQLCLHAGLLGLHTPAGVRGAPVADAGRRLSRVGQPINKNFSSITRAT